VTTRNNIINVPRDQIHVHRKKWDGQRKMECLYQQDCYWEIESSRNNRNQPTTKSNHREILSSYQLRHVKEPNWKPHYNGNVLDKGEASNFKKLLG
jgi:hypothetical protein